MTDKVRKTANTPQWYVPKQPQVRAKPKVMNAKMMMQSVRPILSETLPFDYSKLVNFKNDAFYLIKSDR